MRAGTTTLMLAADPRRRDTLRRLINGPKRLSELGEGALPHEPRSHSDEMIARITPNGRETLFAAFVLERWLHNAPHGPLELGSDDAELAVRALAEAWESTVVHGLASVPRTVEELQQTVGADRDVERIVAALQESGQIEARLGVDRRYAVTDWHREAVAPLATATRLERRQVNHESAPIDDLDVEAGFLLALPLLRLPRETRGNCRLEVRLDGRAGDVVAGAVAMVEGGRVVDCRVELDSTEAGARVTGTADRWLETMIEGRSNGLLIVGPERRLARALLRGLHERLFGLPIAETERH